MAGAIIGSAVIAGGASLLAGSEQADAAERASELQAQATRESIAEQRRQFDLTREDLAPYREVGSNALLQYGKLYGVSREGLLSTEEMQDARALFEETPGYQFRFDEGLRALDRSASARGRLRGGGFTRELQRYGQGIASDEYNTYANRLAALAGTGQAATSTTGAFGAQSAGNISNALMAGAQNQGAAIMSAGTARASGYAGVANAATGATQNWLFKRAGELGYFKP